jgi:hypothetical protein
MIHSLVESIDGLLMNKCVGSRAKWAKSLQPELARCRHDLSYLLRFSVANIKFIMEVKT